MVKIRRRCCRFVYRSRLQNEKGVKTTTTKTPVDDTITLILLHSRLLAAVDADGPCVDGLDAVRTLDGRRREYRYVTGSGVVAVWSFATVCGVSSAATDRDESYNVDDLERWLRRLSKRRKRNKIVRWRGSRLWTGAIVCVGRGDGVFTPVCVCVGNTRKKVPSRRPNVRYRRDPSGRPATAHSITRAVRRTRFSSRSPFVSAVGREKYEMERGGFPLVECSVPDTTCIQWRSQDFFPRGGGGWSIFYTALV